ncbi:MAG: hypothetical protein AVDCRST_MAG49-1897 [uncultured Thermomicrobiales bacterium]|uniref:Uncharacterized protein n=1 Tax=uncultured Thermomicrobiales bacterium TaxID=1645740 RepID=A0A6J4UNB6_9BACT|nr:MAG: hypothetical protein AVDCRST_MAG49-1897 [uncultured Thermomicrobiales bacterium]
MVGVDGSIEAGAARPGRRVRSRARARRGGADGTQDTAAGGGPGGIARRRWVRLRHSRSTRRCGTD